MCDCTAVGVVERVKVHCRQGTGFCWTEKKRIAVLGIGGVLFSPSAPLFCSSGFAQSTKDWLPQAGVKSPFSPLSVPTTLRPVQDSLAAMLNDGYQITTTTDYEGSGALFTLVRHGQSVLCVLTAPNVKTDQNIPTSRCWYLNNPSGSRAAN